MARTWPISIGWMVFTLLDGMILPLATATTSTLPMTDHNRATVKKAQVISSSMRRPGLGGFSMISSAAGRNS